MSHTKQALKNIQDLKEMLKSKAHILHPPGMVLEVAARYSFDAEAETLPVQSARQTATSHEGRRVRSKTQGVGETLRWVT